MSICKEIIPNQKLQINHPEQQFAKKMIFINILQKQCNDSYQRIAMKQITNNNLQTNGSATTNCNVQTMCK